jgi:threonine synthase
MHCYVTHLESALDGARLSHDRLQTVHEGRPLWVRYDLDAIRGSAFRPHAGTAQDMWRCRSLLPLPTGVEPVTLGETVTPLLPARRLAKLLGLSDLWIKDESRLPTGSFKSRGLAMAITMAKHFGVSRVAIPTAGNAGGAMAAYAAKASMEAFVFMPRDTPLVNQVECSLAGAKTYLVNGLITDCGAIVRNGKEAMRWFDLSTLKEPYRLEGKKTMGLELAEQLDWRLPDVILYPTGGGTGLIGMWKAFNELRALGWLNSETMPRMVAVQSSGCAPIPRAFDFGERFAEPWKNAATCASGLRVPGAVGDFMILDAVRASGGIAIAVDEERILDAMRRATAAEGLSICPESAACVLAAEELLLSGWLKGDERVILFNTGAGTKYIDTVPLDLPVIDDPHHVDFSALAR